MTAAVAAAPTHHPPLFSRLRRLGRTPQRPSAPLEPDVDGPLKLVPGGDTGQDQQTSGDQLVAESR